MSRRNNGTSDISITGIGVLTAVGQGKEAFLDALMEGRHAFDVMKRPGRQKGSSFIGAELSELTPPDALSKRLYRRAALSGKTALIALYEAWHDAQLDGADHSRTGLIIGGSNMTQRELLQAFEKNGETPQFVNPTYGLSFMDSDLSGLCTEQFGIKGPAFTVGGASASGQAAVIQAAQGIKGGLFDRCIVIGALADLSYMECHALRSLGAMGTDTYAERPEAACRPFDRHTDGFIFGEACGAIVLERAESAEERGARSWAGLKGWGMASDANRNPNPSAEGEMTVIRQALERAGLSAKEIDYINPHGTGSPIGDKTECRALSESGLSHARINATKSITGHGLSAAGTVEIIAVLLQMRENKLHPIRNLTEPIDDSFQWVTDGPSAHTVHHALSLSMGFGGINTALCLENHFRSR
ncbi:MULTISPECIES: beta-ketoacyl synthase N-terminal-like domain-containing protein [Bacillus]|uniref:beta-ketoacyl synthase N-terminal-like domain-containing protein n=1 Tax=Bacillus TaxID=1386 RepID=UPI0002458B69|nr:MULTISPECIES: beta-ketoacyl synthase N-terminal-like domain-containing protein [Bacillus amyloliquefaciens group]ASZ02871.1 polyketide beta-ketoacyl:ACP synthase [Bacillus velezensis]KZE62752.1 polyketide beta-ketoacyl:ACP synthase [Bacillus amyloliquefaciens]MBO3790765.1 polyketide beta-ketoacyl:ACP synthase [Bacillus velezensis]MCC5594030.1 polyketide beta-ketoacyl:ACP synthase [Bacillus velezensis]MCQ9149369.1 polyketide beta-ketoacyl:ACP synthase [Bacillus amyloliquefaciens]